LWSVTNPSSAYALAMDTKGRLYTSLIHSSSTSSAWLNNPVGGRLGMPALMRIDPSGGSLVVLPQHIDLDSYEQLLVGSTSELPFSAPYKLATSTPWLKIGNSSGVTSQITDPTHLTYLGMNGVFSADTTGLSPGTYDGSVTVTAPAFATSPLTIPVRLAVRASPFQLNVPQEIVLVGDQSSEFSLPSILYTLLPPGLTFTSGTPWITANGQSAIARGVGLPKGINTGQISVSIPGQAGSPFNIIVTLVVTSDARPSVSPAEVNFNIRTDNMAAVTATVAVSTASVLYLYPFQVETDVPWLQASVPSASGYALVTLTANPTGLAPGHYAGQVTLTQLVPDPSARFKVRVPVSLTIGDIPFTASSAALAVMSSPATGPQVLTLSLRSPQTIPFSLYDTSSLLAPTQSRSGSMPTDLTLQVPANSCPNQGMNGCTIGTVTSSLVFTSGTKAVPVPLTILTRPLLPSIAPGGLVNGASFQPGAVAPAR
jgi:hypothetical protein